MSNAQTTKGIRPHTPPDGQAKPKKPKRPRKRGRTERAVIATLQFGLIFYAALVIALLLLESRLVYPGAYMKDDARETPLSDASVVTVEYKSTDRVVLKGRLLERPDSERFLLVFHGNAQKATWLDGWLTQLSHHFDATTLMAEYRGYADDTTPTEKGVLADCLAAQKFLCDRYDIRPTDIILFGRSLGGGCAVAVASQRGAAGLVLDRTFDCAADVAAQRYPFVPVRSLMRNRFDSLARITVYDGPLVSIHGVNDEVIPFASGRRLFERARGPKRWIELDDFSHFDPISNDLYMQITTQLDELMSESETPANDP